MFNINKFLSRFTKITPPDSEVRRCTVDIIKKEIGVSIQEKDVSVQNTVVYIKTSPAIKSRVFIKKQNIILYIKEKLGDGVATDVR